MIPPKNQYSLKTIYIIDDHEIVIKGLVSFLDSLHEYKFIGSALDLDLGLKQVIRYAPDIVILDYTFPLNTGGSIIKSILNAHPACKVILYSFNDSNYIVQNVMANGACAYVLKGGGITELEFCLEAVKSDLTYLSESLRENYQDSSEIRLSKREQDVAYQITKGLTTREIAKELRVSFNTVESHRRSIRKKLGTNHVVKMVNYLKDRNT